MPGLGLPTARRFAHDRGILAGRCTQLCDKTARKTPSSTFRRAAFKSKTPPESGRGGALQSIFLIDFRPVHFVRCNPLRFNPLQTILPDRKRMDQSTPSAQPEVA